MAAELPLDSLAQHLHHHASPEAMYRVSGMTAHEMEAKALEVLGVLTAGKCAQCACVDAGRFPTLPN